MKKISLIAFCLCFSITAFAKKKKSSKPKSSQPVEEKFVMETERSPVTSVAFSKNGRFIASVNLSGYINVFEYESEELKKKIKPNFIKKGELISVQFNNKNNRVVSIGTIKNKIYEIDIVSGAMLTENEGIPHGNCFAQMTKKRRFIFTSTNSKLGTFQMINVAAGKKIRTYIGHRSKVNLISLAPDNRYIVSADASNNLKIWKPTQTKSVMTLRTKPLQFSCIRFSPDSKYIYISTLNGKILVFDVNNNFKNITKFSERYIESIFSLSISPDGKYIGLGTVKGRVIVIPTSSINRMKQY